MDEFEKKLKEDAAAIRAEVSPQLKARIDASLLGVEPIRPVGHTRSSSAGLWWASSLTGLAAAVLVIVLVNLDRPQSLPDGSLDAQTVPDAVELPLPPDILDIRNANFASPLEEELVKLQSDLEKARETVRKDLEFTF